MSRWLAFLAAVILTTGASAQFREANVLEGEFGIAAGAAHYFGDLNTRAALNRPKLALSAFLRKQFGPYIALRAQATFSQLGYSDIYSDNEVQRIRNLSFNTSIFEMAVLGDFNFFRFLPGDPELRFTPYATFGLGFVTYDPYAYLNNEKHYLRPLGTEGQNSSLYPDRDAYGNMTAIFPIGFGVKYNLSPKFNIHFELMHRFAGSDYLDDVSTTYAGIDAFPLLPNGEPSPAMLLQDRSYEVVAVPIGIAGRQRGISSRKDQYISAVFGISFNFMNYKCPSYR